MKRNLLFAAVTAALCSCSTKTFYQVYDVQSESIPSDSKSFVYNGNDCQLTYDFWSEGGNPGFVIKNKTDKIMYVDLSKSALVVNGTSNPYYLGRTFASGSNVGEKKSIAAIGNALGIWKPSNAPGSISIGETQSVSVGAFSSVSYDEQKILVIAPNSSRRVREYALLSRVFESCDVNLLHKLDESNGLQYNKNNSPVVFYNFITYKVGDQGPDQTVTNEFYVSAYKNYKEKDVIEKVKTGCKENVPEKVFTVSSPKKFYQTYTNANSNNNSKDANAVAK